MIRQDCRFPDRRRWVATEHLFTCQHWLSQHVRKISYMENLLKSLSDCCARFIVETIGLQMQMYTNEGENEVKVKLWSLASSAGITTMPEVEKA